MGLTKEQKAIVDCNDKYIVCAAAAGSGKTFTMLARIQKLVNDGVNPQSILALTFTNAAALEMKTRYSDDNGTSNIPEFRTFHSFCYHLLSIDNTVLNKIGYTTIPDIVDDNQLKKLKTTIKHDAGIKLSDKSLGSDNLTPKQEYDRQKYFSLLHKKLHSTNIISFDDLCYGICNLFIDNDDSIIKYKEKYKYIFIDEFQDTDPSQWRFAQSFKDANIFVCGDICQGIYSFRNADSSIMKRMIHDKKWTVLNLTKNFRSTKNIVTYANAIVENTGYGLKMQSDVDGPYVDEYQFNDPNPSYRDIHPQTKEKLINWIKDYIKNPYKGTVAIIDRTNFHVNTIKNLLQSYEIEYAESNAQSEISNYIKSVFDNEYLISWVSSYLSNTNYIKYLRTEALGYPDKNIPHIANFYHFFGLKHQELKYRMDTVFNIRTILSDKGIEPIDKCKEIFKLLDIKCTPDTDVDISTPKKLFDYITHVADTKVESSIYVGTIHSVKGLEFDQVLLCSVNDKGFDLSKDDNLNLYYVGVTRAKTDLTVFAHNI